MTLLINCIALLNEATLTKKKKISFPINKFVINFLYILIKLNFISSYYLELKKSKKYAIVFIKPVSFKQTNVLRSISAVSVSSSPVFVSYLGLVKLLNRSNVSTFIVSTSIGIMTAQEAVLYKTGGKILCVIN